MASVTFKVVQNETVREDGTQLVLLRITYQRKHKYVGTGVYLREKHFNPEGTYDKTNWVRKSYGDPDQVATLNGIIKTWLDKGDKAKDALFRLGRPFTSSDVKQRLENTQEGQSFSDFMRKAVQQYDDRGKPSDARNHRSVLKHLCRFFKVDEETGDVQLYQLSREVIDKFETYLLNRKIKRSTSTEATRRNTTSSYLSRLHQHITAYIIRHNLPSEMDPLRGATFPRMESEALQLTEGELYKFQTGKLPTDTKGQRSIDNARNIYLCSYYMHGLRAGDLVGARVSQLQTVWQMINGKPVQQYRFYSVTQKKNRVKSVLIEDAILPMLLRYAEGKQPDDFLFPFMPAKCRNLPETELMEAIRTRVMHVDDLLKSAAKNLGINKPISMHSARHTFAELLYEETGDLRLVSDALTHSRFDTTQKYLRRGSAKNSDRANRLYQRQQPAAEADEPETLTDVG